MSASYKVILNEYLTKVNSERFNSTLEECEEDEGQKLLTTKNRKELIDENSNDNAEEEDHINKELCKEFVVTKKFTQLEDDIHNDAIYYQQKYEGTVVYEHLDLTKNIKELKEILKDTELANNIHDIINLCSFYKCYKCQKYPDKGFFYTNHYIFDYLNSNNFDQWIDDKLMNQPVDTQKHVRMKWTRLKKMVELYCNDSSQINTEALNDFDVFLAFLICGDHKCSDQFHNHLKTIVMELSENKEKRERDIKDITTMFLSLVLDLPKYSVQLNNELQIEMKIFTNSITNHRIFDRDVMYIFSKVDELSSFNESIIDGVLSKEEIKNLKNTIQLGTVAKCAVFNSMTVNQSISPKIFDCIFSFLCIVEPTIFCLWFLKDVLLLTIILLASIWINWIVDINNNFPRSNNLRRYHDQFFRKNLVRCLSFFKIEPFFKTLKLIKLLWNREKKETLKFYVENITKGSPEYIEESVKRSNYDQMYFNVLYFIHLYQIADIVATRSIDRSLMFALVFRVFVMITTTLAYIGICERLKSLEIFKDICLLLREISFFGFWIILYGLLVKQINSYPILFACIFNTLQILIAACGSDTKNCTQNREALTFLGYRIHNINYWTFFNYLIIVEFIFIIAYIFISETVLSTNSKPGYNLHFIWFYSLGIAFFICWIGLISRQKFYHPYNLMYLYWQMENNGSVTVDEQAEVYENVEDRQRNLMFLHKDLSEDIKALKDKLGKNSPLTKYVHELVNIINLYKYYDCKTFSNTDFLQRNNQIRNYFRVNNLKRFDEFIEDQLENKSYVIGDEVRCRWNQLKQSLEKQPNATFASSEDFNSFLKILVTNEDSFNFNKYISGSTLCKRRINYENFLEIFLVLLLDLPAHIIQLDESVSVKIFKVPASTSDDVKEDIIHIFTDKSCSFLPEDIKVIANKDFKVIRETLKLNSNPNCYLLSTVIAQNSEKFTQKIFVQMLMCTFSLLSVFDMAFDIKLAYEYYQKNETTYFKLTLLIVTIAGIMNLLANEYFKRKYSNLIKYYFPILNFFPIRLILSLLQLSAFFKSLSVTILYRNRAKRREAKEDFKLLLDNILHGHPEYIDENKKVTSFIEMIFEAIPQTILQMYIAVQTESLSPLQSCKITMSLFAMVSTTLQFVAVAEGFDLVDFIKGSNIRVLMREMFYIFFTTISYSLLFYIVPLKYSIYWILFLIFISLICTGSTHSNSKNLLLMGKQIKLINYWTFFNYLTILKTIVYFIYFGKCVLADNCHNNMYFNSFYYFAFISFLYWLFLLCFDNFEHPYNFMYLPWHIRNRVFSWERKIKPKEVTVSDSNIV